MSSAILELVYGTVMTFGEKQVGLNGVENR